MEKLFDTKKLALWLVLILSISRYSHAQFDPPEIAGLEMWLRGDAGVVLNGNYVAEWNDQSGNAHHATSSFDVIRPVILGDQLNGLPCISFDGIDDFLAFPDVANLRTAFWVLRESDQATGWPPRPLLGYGGGVPFLRGATEEFYDPGSSAAEVRNGITRLNFQEINGITTVVPTQYSIVSLVTTGPVTVNTLTMELGIYGRTWWGEMAEVIIYNTALEPAQVLQVETYLAEKYGPTFIAMEDVEVPYGFCDTTLCASPGFQTYQWEDGPSTPCHVVNAPGDYIVTMTDTFGRIISDTVNVEYPGNLSPADQIICVGESYNWDTGLSESAYDFMWDDNSTGSSRQITDAGIYTLTVTDSEGCQSTTSMTVTVDSFSTEVSLGPDVSLCAGNIIALNPSDVMVNSYIWSNDSTTSNITVNESDDYWVEAINPNGCVLRDTIHVEIIGVAPVLEFSETGLCESGSTIFSGISNMPTEMVSWHWNFGDDAQADGQSVSHTYESGGDYEVILSAFSSSGCGNSITDIIHVYEKPIPLYTTNQQCENLPIVFIDNSISAEGMIMDWSWMINGNFIEGQTAETIFEVSGFQPVLLEVTDSHGCVAELNNFIEIKASPSVDFVVTGACQGSLTQFTSVVDDALSGPVTTYSWNFGDNTGSVLSNPTHYYPMSSAYEVQLTVLAANGCTGLHIQQVNIYTEPEADFNVSNACVGAPYLFNDVSQGGVGDVIVSWSWMMEGVEFSEETEPAFVFNSPGLHPVSLLVVTQNGCQSMVSQQIPVWLPPVAAFSYSPEIGEAPFEVQFINETVGATTSLWFFGDTYESVEMNPVHIYTLNGTAYAQLVVMNDAGCADTTGHIITIAQPVFDIALRDVMWETTDNGQRLTARTTNTGNIPVQQIIYSWQIGNDAPVLEEWNGVLLPGETMDFVFASYLQIVGSQFPYICVIAETSPIEYTEVNLTDNQVCKPIANTGLEIFPPYPNPGDERMFIRFITPVSGDLEMRVFDIKGQLVMDISDTMVPKGFHQYFIDISNIPQGHYKLELELAGSKGVVAFMKVTK